MLIRPLSQSDSAAVRKLDQEILGPDRSATWDTYLERFLEIAEMDALPYPPWGCFVAEENDNLVGFLFSERQSTVYGLPPGARIVAIAVHPDHRHQDVGSAMVTALIAQCENEGINQIFAALIATDRRDATFLRSLGFDGAAVRVYVKQIGEGASANGTGVDESEKRAYDAIVERVSEQLKRTQDRGSDALTTALQRASEMTSAAGEFTSEQIERASGYVRRDLFSLSENRERATELRERLSPTRVKDGFLALASEVFDRAGTGLSRLSDRLEGPLKFQTGEVTGPGTLTCTSCESQMRFRDSGRIPPCPRCHKTEFKKGY